MDQDGPLIGPKTFCLMLISLTTQKNAHFFVHQGAKKKKKLLITVCLGEKALRF